VITPGISSGPALPSSFLWGASSGAYQIEGGNVSSDWWWREHGRLPGPPVEAPSGDAADSYHRYAEDMRLLAEAGLTAYRFSVEWARVQPERNFLSRAAIDHYRRMVDTARELGLEPVITLHHITHPAWFTRDGGWQAPDAVDLFGRYVEALSPLLAEVQMVCTINEPNMVAGLVASDGRFQPLGLPTPKPEVSESLLAAHWRACELVRAAGSAAGWSIAAQALHPDPDAEDAALAYAWPTENVFLNAASDDDWVGVQSYTRLRYTAGGLAPPDEAAERTMVGWEYYPAAVGTAIRNAARCAPGIPSMSPRTASRRPMTRVASPTSMRPSTPSPAAQRTALRCAATSTFARSMVMSGAATSPGSDLSPGAQTPLSGDRSLPLLGSAAARQLTKKIQIVEA